MSLVKAESRRFMKRRMTAWMVVIGVLILGAIVGGLALTHEKVTPETRAAAEAQAERYYQEEAARFEQFRAECERNMPPEAKEAGKTCEGPQRDWFQAEQFMPPTFNFREEYGELILAWAAIIAMVGFVMGATFVGAEWSSGSMMNLLTWRPKRMNVLGTKLGVVLGWMAGIGLVTYGLWTGGLYLVGELAGTTEKMTNGTWLSFGLYGLRGLGMILAFTAIGFAVASLGRHTALALGAAVAVIVVGQIGLSIVLQLAQVPFFEQYLIPIHMYAWLNKEVILYDYTQPISCNERGCDEPPSIVLDYVSTGYGALGVIVVISALAFLAMRRRDVA